MTPTPVKSVKTIEAIALQTLLNQEAVTLIDVRETGEYANERIHGAKSFSLSSFDPQKLPIEKNKPFILYCQSGNRSGQAAQKLLAADYGEVTHLQGGLNAWKQAGLPTEKTANAPISIMRQVQIVAGSLVLTGVVLGTLVAPGFYLLSGFVGAGLMFAGISGTCLMGDLLSKLPYNQVK
ncbi:MAG: rhodanese-like domain-containing protein [Microcystaceae cyanobacterium]